MRQVAENGFSRDPAVQSACLIELQSLAADGIVCFPDIRDLNDPCQRLYYEPDGTHQPGEPCTVRADCAGAPGTITLCLNGCLQLTPGQAGSDICLGKVGADGVINAAPAVIPGTNQVIYTGAVCDVGAGLYCPPWIGPTMPTCQPLGAGGAPCTSDGTLACLSQTCSYGACAPLASAGQACDPPLCDDSSCCPTTSTTPVCTPKTPAGASCTSATTCADSGSCTNGICDQGLAVLGFCGRTYP